MSPKSIASFVKGPFHGALGRSVQLTACGVYPTSHVMFQTGDRCARMRTEKRGRPPVIYNNYCCGIIINDRGAGAFPAFNYPHAQRSRRVKVPPVSGEGLGTRLPLASVRVRIVSRAIRILRVRVGGARKGKWGGGKIRMVYLYRFLCVSAGMLAAPIRLQQA